MRIIFLFFLLSIASHAEDWFVDGKDYHNVKVGRVEADRVHVTYDGGIGAILIADMPSDLKKRFSFDPVAAKAIADAREKGRLAAVVESKEIAAKYAVVLPAAPTQAVPAKKGTGQRAISMEDLNSRMDSYQQANQDSP
jgi:hypothetical protein